MNEIAAQPALLLADPTVESSPRWAAKSTCGGPDEFAVITQHTVVCPSCNLSSAAHVDRTAEPALGTLIRFVCPSSCDVPSATVLQLVDAAQTAYQSESRDDCLHLVRS